MTCTSRLLSSILLGTVPFAGFATAAQAEMDSATKARIERLEREVRTLSAELRELKQIASQPDKAPVAAPADPPKQVAEAPKPQTETAKASIDNGRPTIASADGKFSASIRALGQFDVAYYSQDRSARNLPLSFGPDLSSGSNFRRVYLGIQGKAFGDWSYNFNFDFGGANGTESPGRIQSVFAQYDGLKPLAFRIGAYPAPASVEDGTAPADTLFLERNAPSELQRNIAGGDGRDAVSVLYLGDTVFGAFSYTGGKIQDGALFDEQQALLGRASVLVHSDSDSHLLVGVNGTYVIEPAGAVPNGGAVLAKIPGAIAGHLLALGAPPELTVDSNGVRLVNTGPLALNHLWQWGVEAAGNWKNFYAQAGYFGFDVSREPIAFTVFTGPGISHTEITHPSDDSFSGWYLQGSWVLTGEPRTYNSSTGAFVAPKPSHPFALDGSGWGAWEFAARYSDLDLNDHVSNSANVITNWVGATKTFTYYDTVRGGEQRIWTFGLNWYPNSILHFAFDYQWIDIDRLQAPAPVATAGTPSLPHVDASQNVQAISVRSQVSF